MTLAPPHALCIGVRAAVVDGVTIGELRSIGDQWALPVAIDIGEMDGESSRVPARTDWFVVVDSEYPFGEVRVYPSKSSGIVNTFQHQLLNLQGPDDLPWRRGKLCLDMPIRRIGWAIPGNDPIGNREERLRWHLARAVEWVKAAKTGGLVTNGDPFELPHYPTWGDTRIVHDESAATFGLWEGSGPGRWGQVVWDTLPGVEKTLVAVAFTAPDGRRLIRSTRRYNERQHGPECTDRWLGIWWLWPSPVILDPWQVPLNWAELRAVGVTIGVDVDSRLRAIARSIRDRKANVLLLGYPISLRQGEPPSEVHWQAISIPTLATGGKPPKGFRANEQGWWQRDRASVFGDTQKLEYVLTSNWHPDRLQARGRYQPSLRKRSVAIIGCGALGSLMAELLVRGGVDDVFLIDHDTLTAGNLVRHTLSGCEIGKNKAEALARRMTSVAPFASIGSSQGRLSAKRDDLELLLENRDIVIDCTGADEVLMALSQGWWSLPKLFISASVGFEAKRVFIFGHQGCSFSYADFREALDPYLTMERGRWAEHGETLEGAGCWSPLFPARLDDMMLAASCCGKVLEELVDESPKRRLVIFEQADKRPFSGIQRIDVPEGGTR